VSAAKAYGKDLAFIHHAAFGDFALKAAPSLLRLLSRSVGKRRPVVDLGCGSGIWARCLTEAGYRVIGIDISPDMIRLARRHAPGAKFIVGSVLTAPLPPCAAVTALGEVVNYRFDPNNSRAQVRNLFRRVHAALDPGGLFVFDIAEPGRAADTPAKDYWEGSDWAILRENTFDRKRSRLTRRIVSFRRIGNLYRRSEELHELQLYSASDLAADLARAGFAPKTLAGYGSRALPNGWSVIAARKLH